VEGDRACAREVLLPGLRGHHASAGAAPSLTLACRSVAVGAVFGANRLPRGHDLGSNLPRGHIGRRETEADSRCKQSKQSKNLQSFFRPSWVCHCETVRWGDGPPPDFARYVPDHTRLIKTDDFQARSSTALEAAM
jgi:hypothetical protein